MFVCICNAITDVEIIQSIDKYKNENLNTVNRVNQNSEEILEFIKDDIGFDFQCGKFM